MQINKLSFSLVLFVALLLPITAMGQTVNDLSQKISIEAENITIAELLIEIGQKADIKFSYNSKVIKSNRRVDVSIEKKSVQTVLDEVLDDQFDYKLRGNYVIISKRKSSDQSDVNGIRTTISGYVLDAETLQSIPNVSIYTTEANGAITDETGSFSMALDKKDNTVIQLRRKDYEPFSYNTKHVTQSDVEIKMKAVKSISVQLERDSMITAELPKNKYAVKTMYSVNEELRLNQENITDTLYKPISFSLYPGVSTYNNLSGNIIYNLAINFVGYNRGVEGLEIASLSNINADKVHGTQVAGLSNYVGGEVKGVQVAGIFNKIGGNLNGLQVAGISNVNFDNVAGTQVAGINNHVTGNVDGLQLAGIYNQVDSLNGLQVSGVAGVANKLSGFQLSGVANYAKSIEGVQLSALYNMADTVIGTQISGLINIADYVKGSQFGLINVADSVSGISFGLLNFIKNGYKRVGISSNELFPINISLRTGVNKFYTIINAGAQSDILDNERSFYTFGLGLGTSIDLGRYANLNIEATSNYITKRSFTQNFSYNNRGYLGIEVPVLSGLYIAGGVTYNMYLLDRDLLDDSDFNQLRETYISDSSIKNSNDLVLRSWMGYRIGIRLEI